MKEHESWWQLYLLAWPEGLQEPCVGLLGGLQLLPDSAAAAAAAAGSTAGWAGGWPCASAPPAGCGPDRWTWTPLAAASCGWETQCCRGRRKQRGT